MIKVPVHRLGREARAATDRVQGGAPEPAKEKAIGIIARAGEIRSPLDRSSDPCASNISSSHIEDPSIGRDTETIAVIIGIRHTIENQQSISGRRSSSTHDKELARPRMEEAKATVI